MAAAGACGRSLPRATVAGCCLLTLALRLPFLGMGLGVDEGGLAFVARQWGEARGSLYGAYWVDRPPLLVALYKVAGWGGEVGVRLLGCAAAVALVVVVAGLAAQIAGSAAARVAAVLTALLAGSIPLYAIHTPAELLGAVPSAGSVLCLVLAHRRRQARWMAAGGALAVAALLIKQSFVDAPAAAAVLLLLSARADRGEAGRWAGAYLAGAAVPVAATAAWQALAQLPAGALPYALFDFRLQALHALSHSTIPLHDRVLHLLAPAAASGLAVVLAAAAAGIARLRGDRVLAAILGTWGLAGVAGVLAGGSYWSHYLIQLVPVACAGAAPVLARLAPRPRRRVLLAAAAASAVAAAAGFAVVQHDPPYRAERLVADFVRDSAGPGDTAYVMYARANVNYYARLRSPYPYEWSLMVRALPHARAQLFALLRSADRPTWLVGWQDDDRWGIDAHALVDRLIARDYRRVARVCGHPIYLRRDRLRPTWRSDVTPNGCGGRWGQPPDALA